MIRNIFHILATSLIAGAFLQSCAHHIPKTPDIESVDRVFIASSIQIDDLNNTVTDIKTRHATGDITILVRYHLQQPFAASKELAYSQGKTVQKFLQENAIDIPVHVVVSPIDYAPNRIWISYKADKNKGTGIYMNDNIPTPADNE